MDWFSTWDNILGPCLQTVTAMTEKAVKWRIPYSNGLWLPGSIHNLSKSCQNIFHRTSPLVSIENLGFKLCSPFLASESANFIVACQPPLPPTQPPYRNKALWSGPYLPFPYHPCDLYIHLNEWLIVVVDLCREIYRSSHGYVMGLLSLN